jgi:hypothetical protein
MSILDDKQQNIHLELDFSSSLTVKPERREGKRLNRQGRCVDGIPTTIVCPFSSAVWLAGTAVPPAGRIEVVVTRL